MQGDSQLSDTQLGGGRIKLATFWPTHSTSLATGPYTIVNNIVCSVLRSIITEDSICIQMLSKRAHQHVSHKMHHTLCSSSGAYQDGSVDTKTHHLLTADDE